MFSIRDSRVSKAIRWALRKLDEWAGARTGWPSRIRLGLVNLSKVRLG
jgi:hypothetical protein